MTSRRGSRHDERGGIALVSAVVISALLLALAAIGVDLGKAMSRKLALQNAVDLSALGAAPILPVSTEAEKQVVYAEVAEYLNKAGNHVVGTDGDVLPTHLNDLDAGNGEVHFITNERTGLVDSMRVVAPSATIDLPFGAALGQAEIDVAAEATVAARSAMPPVTSILPVWLPSSCTYGPIMGDAAGGSTPAPSASPTYTLNSPRAPKDASPWRVSGVSPSALPYATQGDGAEVRVTIDGLPAGKLGMVLRLTFGDTQHIDYRTTWPVATSAGDQRTVELDLDDPAASRVPAGATVSNPDENWTVTSTVGRWQIWPILPTASTPPELPLPTPLTGALFPYENKGSGGQGYLEVTGGGEVACAGSQRGNFGQLDSPRDDSTQKQTVYARNVAYGLDHSLVPFDAPPSFECSSDGNPYGALIDNRSEDGRNCLYVDPGNDPQGLTDGLLGGGRIPTGEGRLEKPTDARCQRNDYTLRGRSYNNDVLSCYLKPGYTLADIAKDTGVPFDALDESIYDSPRFFWVAVVHQGDRLLKKYLAIKTFAPVFLTDESVAGPATAANGLSVNGGGKIQSMQLFGFNAHALPVPPGAPTTDYQPGSRKEVRLID